MLADFEDNDGQDAIDILVNFNYYWDFVTDETMRGDSSSGIPNKAL